MPLLDHLHAPLAPRRHWESFLVNWAGAIADSLNEHLLPEGYFAEEHAHLGRESRSTWRRSMSRARPPRGGRPTTTLPARLWTPPAATMIIPAAFPDRFEVLVFESEGGARLVAAIELVSPANKDRDAHRRAFSLKCASYLCQGISLIVIDIVTSRQANLHDEIDAIARSRRSVFFPVPVTALRRRLSAHCTGRVRTHRGMALGTCRRRAPSRPPARAQRGGVAPAGPRSDLHRRLPASQAGMKPCGSLPES